MGVENNECVLATTWRKDSVSALECWVGELPEEFQGLFAFIPGPINGKTTIVLAPSGSNKGLATDVEVKGIRDAFIEKLKSFDYEDGSSPVAWVEIGYGEFGQKVLRGNNKNCYTDTDYHVEGA